MSRARKTVPKKHRPNTPPATAPSSQTSQTSQKTPIRAGAKEHLRDRWLEAFRRHGNQYLASQEIPVSRRTIFEWRRKDPAFEEAFVEAELAPFNRIEVKGIELAERGDRNLIEFFLERRRRDVYGKQLDGDVVEQIAKHLSARVVETLNTLIPACCPNCKTDLRLKGKIAEELMNLSARIGARA